MELLADRDPERRASCSTLSSRNVVIEARSTGGKDDAAPAFSAEFVQLKVDVIVTWSMPTALAAKQATSHIPIVC
jgi:ABC-type uncharacterized transport system substrate-binding protein